MKIDKKLEDELMSDFDAEKYEFTYCHKHNCDACSGTDINGEPNGYGCDGLEKRIEAMYQSILKRRLKKYKEVSSN